MTIANMAGEEVEEQQKERQHPANLESFKYMRTHKIFSGTTGCTAGERLFQDNLSYLK